MVGSANKGRITYGVFEAGVKITGGTTNLLPYTIWMPKIDTAHAVTIPSPTTQEVVVATPRFRAWSFTCRRARW
jgi:hypothetical protein